MNTMTLSSGAGISSPASPRATGPGNRWGLPETRPLPVWLPAPKAIRIAPRSAQTANAWSAGRAVAGRTELRLEKYFMFLLAGAGVLGITYGFSCLIDLVQHWAVFNAGVGQFIQ